MSALEPFDLIAFVVKAPVVTPPVNVAAPVTANVELNVPDVAANVELNVPVVPLNTPTCKPA